MGGQGIDAPGAVQQQRGHTRIASCLGQKSIPRLVAELASIHIMPFGGADPTIFRYHNGHGLCRHQLRHT